MRRLTLIGGATLGVAMMVGACSGEAEVVKPGTGGSGGKGGSAGSSASGGKAGAATGGSSATGGSGGNSGGSGGKGGSSGGAAGEGGDAGEIGAGGMEACATEMQEAKLTPANLLFVFDKSGSMECNPPEGDPVLGAMCENFPRKEDPTLDSKWEVTRDALAVALDTLSMQANISAGLSLFPKGTASNSCVVEEEPEVLVATLDAAQRGEMQTVLDAVVPGGLTPIAGATILSYSHLSKAIRARELEGNTFVVLLTDGAETCADSYLTQLVEEDVPNARLFNIRTFVIGAPGSEGARRLLSRIAFEGGTASSAACDHDNAQADVGDCHLDMTTSTDFAADLNDALLAISRTKSLTCEFNVPTNPSGGGVNLDEVNVTFRPGGGGDPENILNDPDDACADADGWQYSPDRTKIILCGPSCDRVQADPEGQVSIVLGCPTIKDVT